MDNRDNLITNGRDKDLACLLNEDAPVELRRTLQARNRKIKKNSLRFTSKTIKLVQPIDIKNNVSMHSAPKSENNASIL
jgi:hypothetical protein